MTENKQFIYLDISQNPLEQVKDSEIIKRIIDPTTGKPYDGLIFSGEFASLNVVNNNNRIYRPPNYLEFVIQIKKQIFSTRGLYGQLEHGKGYSSNYNNISHKILDIWYDEKLQKVFGTIMLLNTPSGRKAKEIYKSGGRFAISGRGGGTETGNADGTFDAVLKLMVTFDIVYHPGFTTSEQIGVTLNENILSVGFEEISKLYESYIIVPKEELGDMDFKQWSSKKLFESQEQNNDDIEILQKSDAPNEQQLQDNLQKAVDQQLAESENLFKKQKNDSFKKLGNTIFDGSAGFVQNGFSE
jgi:hypothetical protein